MFENLKFKWEGKNVNVSAGENFNAEVDTEAVAEALAACSSAGSAIGKTTLTKFFAGASVATIATYITVRCINMTWPWLKAQLGPNDNLLKISVSGKKAAADLNKLVESGDLEKRLQEEIKCPRKALQDDLGDKDTEMIDQLTERLENIRLQSVQKCSREQFGVIGTIVEPGGRFHEVKYNCKTIVSGPGGEGNARRLVVQEGGKATSKHTGGMEIIGADSDLARDVFEMPGANKVKVAVMFSDYSPKFEGMYRLDQTIYDVIADIRKSNDKVTRIKHYKSEEEITMGTKIEILLLEGWIDYLMATVKQ